MSERTHQRDEPKAATVRTAQCLVLAQQSSCFDALGAKTAECIFSQPSRSTACWEGHSTEEASADSLGEAGLWVERNFLLFPFYCSCYFSERLCTAAPLAGSGLDIKQWLRSGNAALQVNL